MEKDFVMIIVIICVTLGLLFAFAALVRSHDNFDCSLTLPALYQATVLAGVIMALAASFFIVRHLENKSVESLIENRSDWTYYLDGEEISYENIDISNYNVSFNEEEQKVFLTRKADKKTTFFPIIIP